MCSNCDAHLAMPISERLLSIYDDGIYDIEKIPSIIDMRYRDGVALSYGK